MNDGAEQDKPNDEQGWPTSQMELVALFGAVVGKAFEAEWAALGGPSAVPVGEGDLPGIYAGHVRGDGLRDRFAEAVSWLGLTAGAFPQLVGKVDARGKAILVLGGVSEETVDAMIAGWWAGKVARDGLEEPVRGAAENRSASTGGEAGAGVTFSVELDGREPA